jgi:hypothetical protein
MVFLFACAACGGNAAPNWQPIDVTVDVGGIVTEPPAEALPLAEAQTLLPFEFNLPGWLPEGFVLQDTVEAVLPTDDWPYGDITVTWLNADDVALTLRAATTPEVDREFVGAGETERVTVNGQPATLTRLGLKAAPRQLALAWEAEGVRYELEVSGEALTADELLRVAESIE